MFAFLYCICFSFFFLGFIFVWFFFFFLFFMVFLCFFFFFFSSRRRHTRLVSDWGSDVCSSDLVWQQGRSGSCCRRPQARHTHVDAVSDRFSDRGSIPRASTVFRSRRPVLDSGRPTIPIG